MRSSTGYSVIALLSCLATLTGCGTAPFEPAANPGATTPLGALTGNVHGGQQRVTGSHIYLYAVATTGYGQPSVSLLRLGTGTASDTAGNYYVTTDQGGNFSVTGDYLCTPGTQVYALAVGGNPGLGAGVNNSAITLMAGLGQCPATRTLALQVPFLIINEVSTVVAAYALAGFAVDPTHIASSGTTLAATGVANAMANIPAIFSIAGGVALSNSPNGQGTVTAAAMNTLANILATCVNTIGPTSGACSSLFNDTSAAAPDTATAALAIAHHPFNNVNVLYTLVSSTGPFQPSLPQAPTDFTIGVQYYGLDAYPVNVAARCDVAYMSIGPGGDLWVSCDSINGNTAYITHLSPTGTPLSNTAFTESYYNYSPLHHAVDAAGNLWAAASAGPLEISSTDVLLSPATGFPCIGSAAITTGTTYPEHIAISAGGTIFVAAYNVLEGPAGSDVFSSPIFQYSPAGNCTASVTVNSFGPGPGAFDSAGNYFQDYSPTGAGSNGLVELPSAPPNTPVNIGLVIGAPMPFAFDANNILWTFNPPSNTNDYLVQFDETGHELPGTGFTGGGLVYQALTIAFDGAGSSWNANYRIEHIAGQYPDYLVGYIAAFTNAGVPITPSAGLLPLPANYPPNQPYTEDTVNTQQVVPDGSGNLWSYNSDGTVSVLLGLATPVATPILPGQLAQRP